MKNEQMKQHTTEILSRLEEATEIRILPGAEAIVAEQLAATLAPGESN